MFLLPHKSDTGHLGHLGGTVQWRGYDFFRSNFQNTNESDAHGVACQ